MKRLVTVLVVGALLSGGCTGSDDAAEARTYYESLDLSSPVAAAETFVEAFDRNDYMTVWLTFDFFAQHEIRSAFNLLQYSMLVQPDEARDIGEAMADEVSAAITGGTTDMWYLFDRLMSLADNNDALLIDLSSPESLGPEDITADGEATAAGEFEGIDGTVTIRLTENSLGRWLVHQIIVPGGDEEQIPWSVPPT